MTNPILSDSSIDLKNMSKQEIRKLTGQDEGDFFQNSIEIDFSTGLFVGFSFYPIYILFFMN